MRLLFMQLTMALALLLSVSGPSAVPAQVTGRPWSAAEVAKSLRTYGHAGNGQATLTQAYGPVPQSELDEIADSLVAIATTLPGTELRDAETRSNAVSMLGLAGIGSSGLIGVGKAVPYAGASERLFRVAQFAERHGIRAAAMAGLKQQPDRQSCLQFLGSIASSQNPVAWQAVHLLGNEMGDEGKALARQLYRSGRVTELRARETLDGIASAFGWT